MRSPDKFYIVLEDASRTDYAKYLSETLHIPIEAKNQDENAWILAITSEQLELRYWDLGKCRSFFLDFVGGVLGYRRLHGGRKSQAIVKACGAAKQKGLKVLDAHCGLGRDGFILALSGCEVLMLERNPIVAALLQDALTRLQSAPWSETLRFQFKCRDASEYLQSISKGEFDVIYLDPMYPFEEKSALPKKEMRILRAIVGDDLDSSQHLELAIQKAGLRVVVKRPQGAPMLAGRTPTFSYKGESTRFDIYRNSPRHPERSEGSPDSWFDTLN